MEELGDLCDYLLKIGFGSLEIHRFLEGGGGGLDGEDGRKACLIEDFLILDRAGD